MKMKNDIGELKEQNTKLIEAVSDLNDRLSRMKISTREYEERKQ
jgi:hypothetical protein